MSSNDEALLAVVASIAGDPSAARLHLDTARLHAQADARRHRQIVEIAGLVVDGAHDRAEGLALIHAGEFPQDRELLDRIARVHLR